MSSDFIPVNNPKFSGNEKKYLEECITSGWISSEGPFVKKFENEFAKLVDRQYGVAVSNGTAALDIAIEALRLGPGDEVIMPSFTIISCIHQIIRSGAKPILVDSDENTWNMDTSQIERLITTKTKAIMVVHIFGLPVDIDPIIKIAKDNNLKVIEDAAQMIGQKYKGKPCGSFGDISTFSFYPNKNITSGEGGMIVVNDKDLYDDCLSLRNLCFQDEDRFVHHRLGWNYRMTNLQAAIGLAQLEYVNDTTQRKIDIGNYYLNELRDVKNLTLPNPNTSYAQNIFWVFGVVISDKFPINAKDAIRLLAEKNIGTRPFFYPLHQQPILKKLGFFHELELPVSENLYKKGFYIPTGPGLSQNNLKTVVDALKKVFNG